MNLRTTYTPARPLTAAVTITPTYTDTVPRDLTGVTLRCARCGAEWDAEPSRGGTFTSAGLDRQAAAHLTTCPTNRKDTRP